MKDEDHVRLAADEAAGRVLVGVDRPSARQFFTDMEHNLVQEKIGEPVHVERFVVKTSFFLGYILALAAAIYSIRAFGWWSLAITPVCLFVWMSYMSASSFGRAGMGSASLILVAALLFASISTKSSNLRLFVALLGGAFFCGRLTYVAATAFLRALVLRNSRAFELLNGEVIQLRKPEEDGRPMMDEQKREHKQSWIRQSAETVGGLLAFVLLMSLYNGASWITEGTPSIPRLDGTWWGGYYQTTFLGKQWCVARFRKTGPGAFEMALLSQAGHADFFQVESNSSDPDFHRLRLAKPPLRIEAKQLYLGKRYIWGRLMAGRFSDFWKMNEDMAIRGEVVAEGAREEFAIEPVLDDDLEAFWQEFVRKENAKPGPQTILKKWLHGNASG